MSLISKQLFIKSTPPHFNPFKPKHLSLPISSCHLNNYHSLSSKIPAKPQLNLNNLLSSGNYNFLRHPIKAYRVESATNLDSGSSDSDSLLNVAESFCLICSVIVAAFFAAKYLILGAKEWVFTKLDYRVFFLGAVMHVGSAVIGVWIRRTQCGRRRYSVGSGEFGQLGQQGDLVKRVEEMENGWREVVKVNRVLAKQLEKLGVRFRVTRRSLKDPIEETAALAQKNLEANKALALQISILEQEIGESQKAMLAMQEQQHKQLELILAMGKALKLLDGGKGPGLDQNAS